jgi:hypothetical protein
MTTKSLGRVGRRALWISPIVIAFFGFFAVLYWLRPHNTTFVLVLTAVMSIFVIGYSSFLARRMGRRMDEVQIASMEYASFHGGLAGMGVTLLLLLLPPFTNQLIDLADFLTARAPDMVTRHRAAVLLALYFGFMLLVLMQTACKIVAAVVWERRMAIPKQ